MFLFLFISLSFSEKSTEVDDGSIQSIIMQIRKGKKFSDVVNVEEIIKEHPSFKNLLYAIDEVRFPEYSCYSEVLVRLNIDCNNANEDQQKLLSIHFTQCYYNITGRLDEFPTDYPDDEKIQHM